MINCTFFDNIYSFYHRLTITLSYIYRTERDYDKKKSDWPIHYFSRRPIIDIQGERQLPYEYLRFTSAIYLLTSYSTYDYKNYTDYSRCNEYYILKDFKDAATAAALHVTRYPRKK